MFKSKLEVDKHVDNCLKKINNETERNLKGFAFAKLYFSVGDYEQARRYVSSYLNVKPKSAEGYHLLGKCLEKLNKKDPALEAYKNSLKLEPKQNSIVLKVCELLSSEDVDMDHTEARYFCELAQSLDPNNSSVYRLKERLITTQSGDPVEISKLLLKELENRPKDVNLRVRLIKHLLQHNLIKEAYKHASTIEEKNLSFFHNNLSWYEIVAEVLLRFQRNASTEVTWEFWLLSVSVLNRLAALSLDEHIESGKTTSEYIAAVFNFDQMLTKASQNVNSCPDRQLISIFLNHYFGQLNLHLSTLAYKQAKCDLLSFKDISNMVIPLLLASYHTNPPDLQSVWYTHTSEKNKNLVRHWHKEASYRCSQAGHILLAAVKNRKSFFIEKATQYSTGMWREQLFKKLFVKRDHHLNMSTSYFVSNLLSEEPVFKLPDPEQLLRYDEVAQLAYPESLHHYIWIALNNSLSDMQAKAFEGLQYSVKNFNNCSAESLSLLDVQAFLYCATLCAKSKTDDKKTLVYYNREKPKVLHASITESLGTLNQSKFLKLAYKMYKNEPDSGMSGIRLSLIHGIEVVRCVGHHGLDVQLLVKLAEIFEERAKKVSKQSEIEHNIARADLYWRTALPLLEKIKNNQFVTYAVNRLFEYKPKEMSISEAISHIEKGKLFSAVQLMKKKEYEKSIQVFEQLKDPYASFYQSQIYKHMADHKMSDNKENVTSEMRSQHIILLSKARDCLYLTLDRLREPSVDRSHPLNAQLGTEIEKMERLLSRVDPDCTNRNECDGMSDENPSSENSVGEQYLSTYTHASFHNSNHFTPKHETHNHSTPLRLNITRQEARPSPERLDAQIRQIAASRDAVFSNIVEQNRLIVDTHRSLLEELRGFKDAINNLTTMVDELKAMKSGFEQIKNIEKSVEEIKNSFDLSNLVDSIQEMKKELSELKKEHNKTNQLSDDDLHFLDSDYAVDYNINSNMGYNPSIPNIYAGYQPGRLQNANPLAAYHGLYPGLYPGFYGPLAIPPTGAIPFTPDQQNIGISATAAYPPPTLTNPSLPALSTSSMGVGMLTGQSLSQTINASPKPLHANNLTPVAATTASFIPPNKALPVNVVITSSDPLPTNVVTSQPILSVTIPPQHIKSNIPKTQQPHNYQIPLPISSVTQIMTTPSILSKPPPAITTQSILSNVAPPIFSAIQPNKGISDKELNTTQNSEMNDTLNKSNVSSGSIEHDPCPDFKPIIPLPDEVPVNTGEEGETELFCEHAKLFRHVNTNGTKEWKERGIGLLKILQNPESGKIRILMRRDQIHKICANHFLTSEMTLTPMTKNDRAYIWAAHDFADEVVVVEKFCVQFKTAEQAKSFYEAFMKAKEKLNVVKIDSKQADTPKAFTTQSSATFGGFVFTSPPTFKPKESVTVATPEIQETPKSGPFSNFSFSKSNNLFKTPTEATTFSPLVLQQSSSPHKNDEDESHEEDFVPTAEFKPVVALPELIEVKTGEEDLEVLFENRCKLFRYDGDSKEWKERGLGNIRVLKGEDIRILMRREQVHKVCCNHTVLKNMMFSFKDNANKAIVWTAQDFSEGVLKTERFTARFKTEEQAAQFIKVLQTAQTSMDENNKVVNSKHHKPETRPRTTSLSEKFKPVKGSWECKNCYIINEGKVSFCVACETPKSGTTPKKTEESGSVFSFGNFNNKSDSTKPSAGSVFSQNTVTSSWGNAFKPAEGSWECKACFVRNNSDKDMCISCQSPREGTAEKKGTSGINLETPGLKFSFGIPATTTTDKAKITAPSSFGVSFKAEGGAKPEEVKTGLSLGFGGAFNPEPGSWECKECLVRNKPDAVHCVSCTNPKDSSIPKKDTSKGIDLETPGLKFNFGMPASGSAAPPLGTSVVTTIGNSATPTNTLDSTTKTDKSDKSLSSKVPQDMKFVFGSPQKHDFEFKPKSPRRISCGQGEDESDGNYTEEEEDNIYFKPVIPLPDKVEVKTGEEEEDVLYCHRAKLFRFVNSEWKERGLGDIKILKRKDNGKLRVVMRRELVLKICLNHNLTDSIEYIKKDDKSWLFHVADYSEGEIVHEQFCLRFKSLEIAKQFREAVTDALKSGSDNIKGKSEANSTNTDLLVYVFKSNSLISTPITLITLTALLASCYILYKMRR